MTNRQRALQLKATISDFKRNSPCYDCNDRFITENEDGSVTMCHSSCWKYKKYKNKIDELNKELRDFNELCYQSQLTRGAKSHNQRYFET